MAAGIDESNALRRSRRWLLFVHAFAALSFLGACTSESSPGPPNVVMIVVDTLRVDHLGVYGAERNTSPNIDRLASQSVRFERALIGPRYKLIHSVPEATYELYDLSNDVGESEESAPRKGNLRAGARRQSIK